MLLENVADTYETIFISKCLDIDSSVIVHKYMFLKYTLLNIN